MKQIAEDFERRRLAREGKNATKANKYGARRVKTLGQSFDSRLEAAVYNQLCFRERAGEIRDIERQVTLELTPYPGLIRVRIDFCFFDIAREVRVAVEAKGFDKPEWLLKLKLWRLFGPYELELWKGTHARPVLAEIIAPGRHRISERSTEEE
jgi:hypothetical protein